MTFHERTPDAPTPEVRARQSHPAELLDADRPQPIIVLDNLHKKHGATVALRGLTLSVNRGTIFALLGPNGSGKTTTIKLMLGLCRPDAGTGRVFGLRIDKESDSVEIRRRTGFVSETKELFPNLDVGTTIRMVRSFFPDWRADLEQSLLKQFALPVTQRVSALSKGMRAKLSLLVACCRRADLLILDEPTDGLDPASSEQLLETLLGMVADTGLTVLLSSHQLHEVERVADAVAIVSEGRVLLQDDLDELRQRVRRIDVHWPDDTGNAFNPASFQEPAAILRVSKRGAQMSLLVNNRADAIGRDLAAQGAEQVQLHAVDLRELFLTLTGPNN